MTLLSFLREALETYPSVKAIKRAIDDKQCTVNGRVEFFSTHKLEEGDEVEITLELKVLQPVETLFEDETFIAYNKPPAKQLSPLEGIFSSTDSTKTLQELSSWPRHTMRRR